MNTIACAESSQSSPPAAATIAGRHVLRGMVVAALAWHTGSAIAGNGLSLIGFGAVSQGMGGADLAVSRDTSALNINPAGLTQIEGRRFDVTIDPYDNFINRHTDQFGNNSKPSGTFGALSSGGYAQHLPNSNLTAGIGLFVQGGAGLAYDNLITPFGTRDDLSSRFSAVRLVPGVGWKLSDALSVGATVGINYSAARQKVFPNTSTTGFQGFRVDSLSGWSMNGKVGFQYRPDPQWVIAAAYTSKAPLKLEEGKATFDYEASGLGRVTYNHASQSGLAVAQEAGIGFSYRPVEKWLVAAEINWVDWSSALRSTTLHLSNPDSTQVPQSLSLKSTLGWRDQYVMAVGAEYRCNESSMIRFGLNYGRNPITTRATQPTMALIGESAIAVGFTRQLAGPWEISADVWYQPPIKVRYSNPESPFGPGESSESWDGAVGTVMLSRRW